MIQPKDLIIGDLFSIKGRLYSLRRKNYIKEEFSLFIRSALWDSETEDFLIIYIGFDDYALFFCKNVIVCLESHMINGLKKISGIADV